MALSGEPIVNASSLRPDGDPTSPVKTLSLKNAPVKEPISSERDFATVLFN